MSEEDLMVERYNYFRPAAKTQLSPWAVFRHVRSSGCKDKAGLFENIDDSFTSQNVPGTFA